MTAPEIPHSVDAHPHGLHVIDTGFVGPHMAAAYLLVEQGRGAFVETGTARSVPRLLEALEGAGLDRGDVDYVIVTHVHLDHAGGAGALMQHLPNARFVVHPRGARHMIDPAKLIAGAVAVYGEATFEKNYDTVVPIPAERVVEAPEGHEVELAGRTLRFLDTPGHAYHHFCVHDPAARAVFTGDTFGLSYRQLDTDAGPFIFPTTTPVHFDPEAMHRSVDRLASLDPAQMNLTHYGPVAFDGRLVSDLHHGVDSLVELARAHADEDDRHAAIQAAVTDYLVARLRAHGSEKPEAELRAFLEMDADLNAQGLVVWLDRNG